MKCERCKKEHDGSFGSGRFCNRGCANARQSNRDEINKKIKASLEITKREGKSTRIFYVQCEECDETKIFQIKKAFEKRKFCDSKCLAKYSGRLGGLKSALSQNRRSKNEILFAELCEKYFEKVLCNEQIFNGWDADVIIEDFKIAVLWNGIWHYKKVRKDHSLEQVQSRDKIKIDQIVECGYIPYIVKDMGSHNPEFVQSEFEKFISWVS